MVAKNLSLNSIIDHLMSIMKKRQIQANYSELPDKLIDAICYFVALTPEMELEEVSKKVGKVMVNMTPTESLIKQVIEREQERIDELALGGIEAVKVGIMVKELPFATLHGRVSLLHEMIGLGKDGYTVERMSPMGELVEITVRDFRSALDATKQLSGLMEIVENATEEDDDSFFVDVT